MKASLPPVEEPSRSGRGLELLSALNGAAASLQRSAHSEAKVFEAFHEQIVGLGLGGGLTLLDERGEWLELQVVAYPGQTGALLRSLEQMTGITADGFSFRVSDVDGFREAVETRRSVYLADSRSVIAQVLPGKARPFADRIMAAFGMMPSIYAPLIIDSQVEGVLSVGGAGVIEDDVAAFTAFANHIAVALANARLFEAEQRRRREAEALREQTREQAQQMQQLIDTVPDGILLLDEGERIVLANTAAQSYLPLLTDTRVGEHLKQLGDRPLADLVAPVAAGSGWHEVAATGAAQGVAEGKRPTTFEVMARPMEADAQRGGWVLMLRDVTVERRQQAYLQAQDRLATVGQLAAGIAHDFNNILSVIILYSEILERQMSRPPSEAPGRNYLAAIVEQARRAAQLTGQVLDFSRQAVMTRSKIDLLVFLKEVVKLLERTLPATISVKLVYMPGHYFTNADPTRIQQAIMNLASRARDGMPEGGSVRIELASFVLGAEEKAPLPEMAAGPWIRLRVFDSGPAVPAEVLSRIFDPFYTTKGAAGGMGLSLAQVYGIVKQHDGAIHVESEAERGTTFTIYLPGIEAEEPATEGEAVPASGGRGRILLVEDTDVTREAIRETLEVLGYEVLSASTGNEALAQFEQAAGGVDLVLSDIVLPGMNGLQLGRRLLERQPDLKILLMTGYPQVEEAKDLLEKGVVAWIQKPFTMNVIARRVEEAMGE